MYSLEAKIRKQQSILICSGLGIIIFGVWSIVRFLMMFYMDKSEFEEMLELFGKEVDISKEMFNALIFGMIIIALIIDLCVRLYIGAAAINEGRGISRRPVYIFAAAIYVVVVFGFDVADVLIGIMGSDAQNSILDNIIDITINIATLEIVISSIRIRSLNRKFSGDLKLLDGGH